MIGQGPAHRLHLYQIHRVGDQTLNVKHQRSLLSIIDGAVHGSVSDAVTRVVGVGYVCGVDVVEVLVANAFVPLDGDGAQACAGH